MKPICCFRPLQFCTGVVQDEEEEEITPKKCFRPLQFCTGVVHEELPVKKTSCFRPLHFCTGVVPIENVGGIFTVLDPCIFARV